MSSLVLPPSCPTSGECGKGGLLIQGWVLINFFCLWDGRLFEVGTTSRFEVRYVCAYVCMYVCMYV